MKKLTAIFLLGVFMISANCQWILYYINYFEMKQKVSRVLETKETDTDLQQLAFSDQAYSKIQFRDGGRELELNGKMYDIVKIEHHLGKKVVYCLADNKETRINSWSKKHGPQKNIMEKEGISKIYIPSSGVNTLAPAYHTKEQYFSPFLSENICTISYEILKPPPTVV